MDKRIHFILIPTDKKLRNCQNHTSLSFRLFCHCRSDYFLLFRLFFYRSFHLRLPPFGRRTVHIRLE